MNPRLFRLIEIHRRTDDALRRELRRPATDWMRVLTLKKLKLRIKDLTARMMARSRAATPQRS